MNKIKHNRFLLQFLIKAMNKQFSIEDGFQIIMLFLTSFWWDFLQFIMINRGLINKEIKQVRDKEGRLKTVSDKDQLHSDNDFFFLTVCDGTSDDYFEEVIENRMNIPPLKQHDDLIVNEDLLFQLAIDFCDYFNKKYQEHGKDSLRFAIDWLKDMQKHPEKHQKEWGIWSERIIAVTEKGEKSLSFF